MKKAIWLFVALGVALSVVGCSKEDGEISNTVVATNESQSRTQVDEYPKQEMKESSIGKEKVNEEVKGFQENNKLSSIDNTFNEYKKWFILSHPESASEDEIEKGVITTYYYDIEGKVPVEVVNYDGETCNAIYSITTQNGNQYQYDLVMEKIYKGTNISLDRGHYYTTKVNLKSNDTEINNFNEYVFSELIPNEDNNRDMLLAFFENCENIELNSLHKKTTCQALDYVKVDITGTGTNDYLVVFGESDDHRGSNIYDSDISHLSYYRIEEGKSYPIRYPICELPDSHLYHYPSKILRSNKLDDIAYFFDGGLVFDFNQNGINEIYMAYSVVSGMSSNDNVIMIEWNGNMFVPHIIHSTYTYNHFSAINLSFNFANMSLNISEEFFVPTDDVVVGMPAAMGIIGISHYTYKWYATDDIYIMTQKILDKQSYLGGD